jgi:hypothetical protein
MIKLSRILLALIPVAYSLAFSQGYVAPTDSPDSFDRPLKKQVVDFGPSANSFGGKVRLKLTCYSYPAFMVKEYDVGEPVPAWQAIVPARKGAVPVCTRNAAVGEWRIDLGEGAGFFKGAKGNLVFIDSFEGDNGGWPFLVYDIRTEKEIFDDSARESMIWDKKVEDAPFDRMRFGTAQDGRLYLRYLRVYELDCNLNLEKTSCWEKARKILGLKSAQMPVCSGYEGIASSWVSVIAYPVEVFLFPQPTINPIAGRVKCWPGN